MGVRSEVDLKRVDKCRWGRYGSVGVRRGGGRLPSRCSLDPFLALRVGLGVPYTLTPPPDEEGAEGNAKEDEDG